MAEGHRAVQTVRTASGASSPSTSFRTPEQEEGSACLVVGSGTQREEPPGTCSLREFGRPRFAFMPNFRVAQTIFRFSQNKKIHQALYSPRGLPTGRNAIVYGNSAVAERCLLVLFRTDLFCCVLLKRSCDFPQSVRLAPLQTEISLHRCRGRWQFCFRLSTVRRQERTDCTFAHGNHARCPGSHHRRHASRRLFACRRDMFFTTALSHHVICDRHGLGLSLALQAEAKNGTVARSWTMKSRLERFCSDYPNHLLMRVDTLTSRSCCDLSSNLHGSDTADPMDVGAMSKGTPSKCGKGTKGGGKRSNQTQQACPRCGNTHHTSANCSYFGKTWKSRSSGERVSIIWNSAGQGKARAGAGEKICSVGVPSA